MISEGAHETERGYQTCVVVTLHVSFHFFRPNLISVSENVDSSDCTQHRLPLASTRKMTFLLRKTKSIASAAPTPH
jgi:hypothetical protein